MSFLDNTKNAGWGLTIIGLLMVLGAIVAIVTSFTGEAEMLFKVGGAVIAIGALLAALAYLKYGNNVRVGNISDKLEVLGNFVRIVGVTSILAGLFGVVGSAIQGNFGGVGTFLVQVILGFIIIWVSKKMMDEKATTFDKIVWIILLVIFVVELIMGIASLTITGILMALVYLMMLVFLFDGDVKKKMGM